MTKKSFSLSPTEEEPEAEEVKYRVTDEGDVWILIFFPPFPFHSSKSLTLPNIFFFFFFPILQTVLDETEVDFPEGHPLHGVDFEVIDQIDFNKHSSS